MRYFIQTIHLESDLCWQQRYRGEFKYRFDFNIKIQQSSNANIWLYILPFWLNRDGLKYPAGQECRAPWGDAYPCGGNYSAGMWYLPGETFWFAALPTYSNAPRAPCSKDCTERKGCSWPPKKYYWSREPQSFDSPKVYPMNGPPKRNIIDEQRSSRAIYKTFLKIVPEAECYPRISKDLSRSEIPLCARTWVWKQL